MDDAISRAEHTEFVKRMEEENRRQNKRLDTMEENIETFRAIANSVDKLADNMKSMTEELTKQGKRIEKIEQKPGDNWNTIVKSILTNFGSTIAALIIGALILSNAVK